MSIKLSRLLRYPRWYQQSLRLLFEDLEKRNNIQLNQEIKLGNGKTIKLDQPIFKKYFPDADGESERIKFDIMKSSSAVEAENVDSSFLITEKTLYRKNGRVVVKDKRRLIHTFKNAAQALLHKKTTQQFYPLEQKNHFTSEHHEAIFQENADYEEIIATTRQHHTEVKGRLLSEIIQDPQFKYSLKNIMTLFASVVDEVENLQLATDLASISLNVDTIIYDAKTHRANILNYVPSRETINYNLAVLFAQLMGLPLLKIQLARTHDRLFTEITQAIEKHYQKSQPGGSSEAQDIIAMLEDLLTRPPQEALTLEQVKNRISSVLTQQQVVIPIKIQNTLVKKSFFNEAMHPGSPDLSAVFTDKLKKITQLPWKKISSTWSMPPSIKTIEGILNQQNLNSQQQLRLIQKFCQKCAAMPKWKKFLHGHRSSALKLVCLLQTMDKVPLPEIIHQLDLFTVDFKRSHKRRLKTDEESEPQVSSVHPYGL